MYIQCPNEHIAHERFVIPSVQEMPAPYVRSELGLSRAF